MKREKRIPAGFALLLALLAVLLVCNLLSGSTRISLPEALQALFHPHGAGALSSVLWSIRMPRLLAAAILGGALAVSGFLLQTFFLNPIAGPYVLGVSSGAKLTVALVMILCLSRGAAIHSGTLILAAFVGSMVSMGFILLASRRLRGMGMLIVCGVMIGYICSAITEFVITFADDSNIVNLHNWSMGSFSGVAWGDVAVSAAAVIPATICAVLLSKPMSAYQLGENYARSMGVNVPRFRTALILLSSILAACVTAFAGPISFVGIAVPHLAKRLFATAKPLVMVPACFLGGSVFCLFCDLIARTIFAPTELSISSVTAVFGAPVVIWMLLTRKRGDTA